MLTKKNLIQPKDTDRFLIGRFFGDEKWSHGVGVQKRSRSERGGAARRVAKPEPTPGMFLCASGELEGREIYCELLPYDHTLNSDRRLDHLKLEIDEEGELMRSIRLTPGRTSAASELPMQPPTSPEPVPSPIVGNTR